MEQEKQSMYDCLIEWLQIINGHETAYTAAQLSCGYIFASSLNQIDPNYFSQEKFLSKIKQDVDNWRLKVSNLRKVVDQLFQYYIDIVGFNLLEEMKPDVNKIGERCDKMEIGKTIQLILGCSVNCVEKEKYITQIMELEEDLQRNIMRAIQDIQDIWQNVSPPKSSMSLTVDMKQLTDERDALAQRCHESDLQISSLLEEKSTILHELTKLQTLVQKYENPETTIGDDGTSIGPIQVGSARYNDLRKQVAVLKDDLIQAETAKDDLKMKCIQSEKEIIVLQAKCDDLSHYQAEVEQLKDEVDALRETNEKAKIYENQILIYKKKLEDYNDLKKQVKSLEERSAEYLKQNLHLEDEGKDKVKLKGQVDLYKKEMEDLHAKLDTEINKTTKYEVELNVLQSKLTAFQREKENLTAERDHLIETLDEIRCGQSSDQFSGKTVSSELGSSSLREKLDRLEAENKALRASSGGQTALADLLGDANQRSEKYREQLKECEKKILVLEGQLGKEDLEPKEQAKVASLEAALANKNNELAATEVRYKKLIEKAKEVIKSLDQNGAIADDPLGEKPEARGPAMSQLEERLMVTAYYSLGLACQRDAVDTRLALLNSPGQSFLARQRQPAPRKPLSLNYKK